MTKISLLSLLDLTNLQENANNSEIIQLTEQAKSAPDYAAAICIQAQFIPVAEPYLLNTPIKVATVVNFPAGTSRIEQARKQIINAIALGADELDIVLPYQQFLAGERESVWQFLQMCRETCGNKMLKIIFESGAFENLSTLGEACQMAIDANIDFLKTSTGKIPVGATLPAAQMMLNTIAKNPSKIVGFKASGGIRSREQAQAYIDVAVQTLGENYISAKTFRIGTSRLL